LKRTRATGGGRPYKIKRRLYEKPDFAYGGNFDGGGDAVLQRLQ
jgi:hypothetical protein